MTGIIHTASHAEIIARSGGQTAFGRKIGVSRENVKMWSVQDSIPAAYWKAIVDEGLASYLELAEYAERKSVAKQTAA